MPIPTPVRNIPGRTSAATNELLFSATLPALGFSTFYFEAASDDVRAKDESIRVTKNEACTLQNQVKFNITSIHSHFFSDLKLKAFEN